jgi:hypothetical protein
MPRRGSTSRVPNTLCLGSDPHGCGGGVREEVAQELLRLRQRAIFVVIVRPLFCGLQILPASANGQKRTQDRRFILEASLKVNRWLCMMIFASVSSLAHAHGEEVLLSVYAELASIAICLMLLFTWRRAAAHRVIGLVACVAGLFVGNWALSSLPFLQYGNLITAVGFVVPLAATVSAIYVSHRLDSRQRHR